MTGIFEPAWALSIIIIGFAALIHGAVGIGFPLVATPLLSMIMDGKQAVMLLVVPTLVLNIANITMGKQWQKNIAAYWPLAFWGVIGSFTGTHLLIDLSDALFRPLLAGMLIFYLAAEHTGLSFSWIKRHPGMSMVIFGTAAGISAGMVNVMLPFLIIYALEIKMPKDRMILVFNFCFLSGKLTQGFVLFTSQPVIARTIPDTAGFAIFGLSVMLLGMKIRKKIDTVRYQKWLKIFLAAMTVLLLIKSASSFFPL